MSDRRKTLTGLKRRGTLNNWKVVHRHRLVRIWSSEWSSYWRRDGSGYTVFTAAAGVYTLADAIERTHHCGPEKRIEYWFAEDGAKVTQ